MWKSKEKEPILEFLGWVALILVLCQISYIFLRPYAIALQETNTVTVGYVIYAIIGIFFDTPMPCIAIYIVLKRHHKIASLKEFIKLIFHVENVRKTVVITSCFCLGQIVIAILCGARNDVSWYLFFPALPVLILGGGIEEVGWRGFLQPAMEKRFRYPFSTLLVIIIWYTWHLPLWLDETSNHFNDSLIGFGINIFVWSFAFAAIYKATKCVFACVMYHAFTNTIGLLYDWNALFDAFPGSITLNVYRALLLVTSIVVWIAADHREKQSAKKSLNS